MMGHVSSNGSQFPASQPLAYPPCAHEGDSAIKYAPLDVELQPEQPRNRFAEACVPVPRPTFPRPTQIGARIQSP